VVETRQERGPVQLSLHRAELREFSETANAAKELVKKSYLYANNHFSSKSVVNAVMLKAQLGQPIEGEYPESLVEKYPELEEAVKGRLKPAPDETCPYEAGSGRKVTLTIRSVTASLRTTSIPEITCPNTVYWPFHFGCADSEMNI
jgi:hypothetical protein